MIFSFCLLIIGNKALIKLLGSLYEVGMDHMCDNVGGLISLLNDSNANTETQLNSEERETVIEILSKMCAKRSKVRFSSILVQAKSLYIMYRSQILVFGLAFILTQAKFAMIRLFSLFEYSAPLTPNQQPNKA